jgi:hypothetical protein
MQDNETVKRWRARFDRLTFPEKKKLIQAMGVEAHLLRAWQKTTSFEDKWFRLKAIAAFVNNLLEETERCVD